MQLPSEPEGQDIKPTFPYPARVNIALDTFFHYGWQSVSSSFTWAVTRPPPDIEVPAVAAAHLVIESRFDLLTRLFRTPLILLESLPAPTIAAVTSGVNVSSTPGAATETIDKHAFAAITEANTSHYTMDSDETENNTFEEEELEEGLLSKEESHKEEEQEIEFNLQGLGGGAVVVGCSADTDTVDMLHALSQSLKTSNLKASVQVVSHHENMHITTIACPVHCEGFMLFMCLVKIIQYIPLVH
jgi:hypothetical protein